jgi:hypothetical protein
LYCHSHERCVALRLQLQQKPHSNIVVLLINQDRVGLVQCQRMQAERGVDGGAAAMQPRVESAMRHDHSPKPRLAIAPTITGQMLDNEVTDRVTVKTATQNLPIVALRAPPTFSVC